MDSPPSFSFPLLGNDPSPKPKHRCYPILRVSTQMARERHAGIDQQPGPVDVTRGRAAQENNHTRHLLGHGHPADRSQNLLDGCRVRALAQRVLHHGRGDEGGADGVDADTVGSAIESCMMQKNGQNTAMQKKKKKQQQK